MALPGLSTWRRWAALLYYVFAGSLIIVSAVLVLQRHRFGVPLFWLVVLGTIFWSIWKLVLTAGP